MSHRLALSGSLLLGAFALAGPPPSSSDPASNSPAAPPLRWWKGNTHAHTLWSDGDAAPELVVNWYRQHDYHFLVLSDHNIIANPDHEKWFPILDLENSPLTSARVVELHASFGDAWVTERTVNDQREMRLKTLSELRARFESPGQFLLLTGEEITASFHRRPVHINGLNLAETIRPLGGESIREVIQRNIDAVIEQGRRLGRPTLAHVNHPNFQWGLTVDDIAAIEGDRFFEVYNGHSSVRNYGDADHPSTESMWDIALTTRLTQTHLSVLYALATDDSHAYFNWGVGHINPGRGWIMVRSTDLDPDHIIDAMKRGDFYASSGVSLNNIDFDGRLLAVNIQAEPGLTYTTRFIGTRRIATNAAVPASGLPHGPVGESLLESFANPAIYTFTGDEYYVRAVVTSSRLHPNPYAEGDHEQAWTQPVVSTEYEGAPSVQ